MWTIPLRPGMSPSRHNDAEHTQFLSAGYGPEADRYYFRIAGLHTRCTARVVEALQLSSRARSRSRSSTSTCALSRCGDSCISFRRGHMWFHTHSVTQGPNTADHPCTHAGTGNRLGDGVKLQRQWRAPKLSLINKRGPIAVRLEPCMDVEIDSEQRGRLAEEGVKPSLASFQKPAVSETA